LPEEVGKMIDLKTSYMGLELDNPFIVGASEMSANVETLKRMEEAGAGAIVLKSLFEEQIQLERLRLDDALTEYDERHAEMIGTHPNLEHAGPKEHLFWVRKSREAVKIPLIASLNAVEKDTWVEYAELLEDTGVDGLELNFYSIPVDVSRKSSDVEEEQLEILGDVIEKVDIPVSVKLSPFYANPLNVISEMDKVGVSGFVLFNRFFQPDIDIDRETSIIEMTLSGDGDYKIALRYTGLLSGDISGDICASGGVHSGKDAAKLIMAGASCVQVVSALYKKKFDYLKFMQKELVKWMEGRGFGSLDDFRGRMSKRKISDPFAYERAQYVGMLMRPESVIKQYPDF
jgi:dihydroorotate dehydrogenase (fumarate)